MMQPIPSDRRGARRILHPSDFSTLSARAFAEALQWARAERAELLLLHVVAPVAPIIGDEYVSNPWLYPEIDRSLHEGATEILRRLVARAKEQGVRGQALVLNGRPADQILHAAESREVDLIVMGTHGRTGFMRLILGSLAEEVIAKAPCPVLVVGASVVHRAPVQRHLAVLGNKAAHRVGEGAGDGVGVKTVDQRPERCQPPIIGPGVPRPAYDLRTALLRHRSNAIQEG